jgi:hypothetical protein
VVREIPPSGFGGAEVKVTRSGQRRERVELVDELTD